MTEYENEPFIIGDYHHNQVEFMHLAHEKWYTAPTYPDSNSRIFGYEAVTRPGKVFIFGGCCYGDWSIISVFENDAWGEHGRLKRGRINFMTVTYGTDVLIIGGRTFLSRP